MADTRTRRSAYAASGVDVAAGGRAVELMRAAVESTRREEVIGALGGFAATVGIPTSYRDPVLVSSTDGVGTKTAIAGALGRYDTVGVDLVAMCADDVACAGAAPLFFLDYVAVGRLDPANVAELVGGVAAGCRAAGCALVGGETAEHPGLMDVDAFDLAGCCVGVVDRDRRIDGDAVREGDALVGIASSGLHANGFSLVRALIAEYDLDLRRPFQEQLVRTLGEPGASRAIAVEPGLELATLGEVLLTPTTIYAPALIRLRDGLEAAGASLNGIAHITGGGLPGNIPRALPVELAALVDPARWPMPSIMRLMADMGGLSDAELRATFNGGLGMVIVVPLPAVSVAIDLLARERLAAWEVGRVVESGTSGTSRSERYVEASLA